MLKESSTKKQFRKNNFFSFYNNKRVLITGHTGFKGTWLCRMLINAGAIVTGYSLQPPTQPNLFSLADVENKIKSVIGDVRDFDWLLDHQDEYHWDFVQIQMNFLDWRHASVRQGWRHDADAEYLYEKLEKKGIQAVVMEPLRGGAFGRMASELTEQLKAVRPNDSTARWAFRWVGSYPNILTTLSGMNRMDHLVDNVETFSPLEACTEAENKLLADIADQMSGFPTIPCTTCEYCMPCPYGVNIPGNFAYYNEAVNEHILPLPDQQASDYLARKEKFAEGMRKALPDVAKWANQCTDCEACLPKCPQQIRIPNQMARIVETLRRK